jgi:hypothetical protein
MDAAEAGLATARPVSKREARIKRDIFCKSSPYQSIDWFFGVDSIDYNVQVNSQTGSLVFAEKYFIHSCQVQDIAQVR